MVRNLFLVPWWNNFLSIWLPIVFRAHVLCKQIVITISPIVKELKIIKSCVVRNVHPFCHSWMITKNFTFFQHKTIKRWKYLFSLHSFSYVCKVNLLHFGIFFIWNSILLYDLVPADNFLFTQPTVIPVLSTNFLKSSHKYSTD